MKNLTALNLSIQDKFGLAVEKMFLKVDNLTFYRQDACDDSPFDPSKRAFTEEELKPQPIIRKSKKVHVPADNKVLLMFWINDVTGALRKVFFSSVPLKNIANKNLSGKAIV